MTPHRKQGQPIKTSPFAIGTHAKQTGHYAALEDSTTLEKAYNGFALFIFEILLNLRDISFHSTFVITITHRRPMVQLETAAVAKIASVEMLRKPHSTRLGLLWVTPSANDHKTTFF